MDASRLRQITYRFPAADVAAGAFFAAFAGLLAQAPGVRRAGDQITLTPTAPPDALPVTVLEGADVAFPQIVLDTDAAIDLRLGSLRIRSSAGPDAISSPQSAQASDGLAVDELALRLDGHLNRVDHTGVNLPVAHLDQAGWEGLRRQVAAIANVYRYPTGGEWPFIVPATDDEFRDEIRRFAPGREPKFEMVYDPEAAWPVFQFALGTDLTRPESEALFPEPHGRALPGIGEFFRSVFLAHPWAGLTIRVDLYYRDGGPVSDWQTGEWLVTEGGRLR